MTRAIGIGALQELMTAGMPPLVSQRLGDWRLRSAGGYTGRANSALPVGDPGIPLPEAVERVTAWYGAHDQPALIQLPHPTDDAPTNTELGALLAHRGWRFFTRTLVMTTPSRPAPPALADAAHIAVTDAPTDDWWAAASPRAVEHRRTLEQVLTRIARASYLTAYVGGRPLGHARLAFNDGWSGAFDVHTDPAARRTGVARAMMTVAARVAGERRIPLQYLQVAADNAAAVRLYESLGWRVHHAYHYATPRGRD